MENNSIINIGRAQNNDVVLNDVAVSNTHARIIVNGDGSVTIQDLNSTNGTYVNGQRISGQARLSPGDRVMLGNTPFDWQSHMSGGTRVAVGMPGVIPTDAEKVVTVGRNANNSVRVNDQRVSGQHCSIVRHRDGSCSIIDNSSNGTYVNGQRVPGSFRLSPGDRVMLANAVPLDWERAINGQEVKGGGDGGRVLPPEPKEQPGGNTTGGDFKVLPPQPPVERRSKSWIWFVAAGVILLLVGAGVWWALSKQEHKIDPSEIYATYDKSVVIIAHVGTYDVTYHGNPISDYSPLLQDMDHLSVQDGEISTDPMVWFGTGFYVSDDGKIMTNHHVVSPKGDESSKHDDRLIGDWLKEQLRQVTDYTGDTRFRQLADGLDVTYRTIWLGVVPNGRRFDVGDVSDYIKCEVLDRSDNEKVDLGLIQSYDRTTPAGSKVVDVLDFSPAEHRRIGDKIFTIGFPTGPLVGNTDAGLQANHQSGEVTQERGTFEYGHNIKVTSGASGSPVFDEYGKFAGVIYAVFGDGSNGYNLAVRPEQAAKFYKKNLD